MKTNRPNYYWICGKCATSLGAEWPEGHAATMSKQLCGNCKNKVICAAVSDWSWVNSKGEYVDSPDREL